MRPYRNSRIVDVIQELYFTGGSNAFANRFRNLFPESEDSSVEEVQHEVPIAMVALVATAVSLFFSIIHYLSANTTC